MSIGSNIKSTRKKSGLSQIEVAQKAKIAVNSLRLYEAGKREPTIQRLEMIANAIGVPLSQLLDISSESPDGKLIDSIGVRVKEANEVINSPLSTQAEIESNRELLDELDDVLSVSDMVIASEITRKCRSRIEKAFNRLSPQGQLIAADRIEELAKVPDYQR